MNWNWGRVLTLELLTSKGKLQKKVQGMEQIQTTTGVNREAQENPKARESLKTICGYLGMKV
jgi:hypothetical protein